MERVGSYDGFDIVRSRFATDRLPMSFRPASCPSLSGVDPNEDIQLSVDGNVLRLRGERRAEEHDERRSEIRYGSFERLITLPRSTRAEDVTAEYVNGVLTVSMPTTGAAEPTTIPVTHREPAQG